MDMSMFNATAISMYAVSNDSGPNGGQNVGAAAEGAEAAGDRTVIKLTAPGSDGGFVWFHDEGRTIPANSIVSGEGNQVHLPISTLSPVLALLKEYGGITLLTSPDGTVAFLQTGSQPLSASSAHGKETTKGGYKTRAKS